MSRAPALALFAATAWGALGCGLNQEGVGPKPNSLFYPASAAMAPDGDYLFVANSNADLRYNDGTVVVMDLKEAAADRVAGTWQPCPIGDYVRTPRAIGAPEHECCWDQLDENILNCDERHYIRPESTVRIGSFAAGMIVQPAECPDRMADKTCGCTPLADLQAGETRLPRLFVAVRGNTSVTWANIVPGGPPHLECGLTPNGGGTVECDADHRVIDTPRGPSASFPTAPLRPATRLPDEPYAMAIDSNTGLLYLGHLSGNTAQLYTGGFSLIDVGTYNAVYPPPRFINPYPSPFPGNTNGSVGITSLMWRPDNGTVYATSRFVPQVAGLGTLDVQCVDGIRDFPAFPNGDSFDTMVAGGETRGIQFAGIDKHAFVLQRSPPTLIEFDGGHNPVAVAETCSSPTFLYKHETRRGERLFVNCFDVGEVYVFDPGTLHLERTFQVGRGPAGMVFPGPMATIAYVIGFGDNNVSVVDLDPASPTEYHVIQRLGFPTTVPR